MKTFMRALAKCLYPVQLCSNFECNMIHGDTFIATGTLRPELMYSFGLFDEKFKSYRMLE